jgi:hypothetical protein
MLSHREKREIGNSIDAGNIKYGQFSAFGHQQSSCLFPDPGRVLASTPKYGKGGKRDFS